MAAILGAENSWAGQWVSLNPADIVSIQITQSTNSAAQTEGLYIALKNPIIGEAASYCARKDFVVITDAKLIDRAFSAYLFAAASQKTIQFYLDGAGKCAYNGPIATIFTLNP
ncbi:hypothetical protein [Cellvibrio sp. PSBB023]|uniref:hypothetical protein n=1 Tax=Cellvibrio sp. PSBB023 TaxID=1945512 RepID=UPI0009901A8B|nr:hypothetical protein [Cellvibrio sp. PSBB023]AQT60659.1 hypothetical protein B0D95_11650 [Cellvibrio sp. PSBB023]